MWLYIFTMVPPIIARKLLPDQVIFSNTWLWMLFTYGVFFTVAFSTISVLLFGSSRTRLYKVLRVLFLATGLTAGTIACLKLIPDRSSTLAVVGSWVTFIHMIAGYMFVWYQSCRSRARPSSLTMA
jgi:hypothetical protein